MTRREQLEEQYEDALFALLMDEVAASEGAKALEENERLKQDPAAEVPDIVTERCMGTMRRAFRHKKLHSAGRTTAKIMGKVAVVVGICVMLFTVVFAASDTVRTGALNLAMEMFGDHTTFRFAPPAFSNLPDISFDKAKGEYTLAYEQKNAVEAYWQFVGGDNQCIDVMYVIGDGAQLAIDSEAANIENIQLNGRSAVVATKENYIQIVMTDMEHGAFVDIIGVGIEKPELLRLVSNIKFIW